MNVVIASKTIENIENIWIGRLLIRGQIDYKEKKCGYDKSNMASGSHAR